MSPYKTKETKKTKEEGRRDESKVNGVIGGNDAAWDRMVLALKAPTTITHLECMLPENIELPLYSRQRESSAFPSHGRIF